MKKKKIDIRELSKKEIQEFFLSHNEPSFKGTQVYQWLWKKGVHDFDLMTNLSFGHRALLKTNFEIKHIKIDEYQRSIDGTIKNAVKLHDQFIVESVLIPTSKRSTACVSSQVGCSLDCIFCATAALKRIRNLNADEIYDQVVAMDNQSKLFFNRPLTNIVFMGMGEPMMNYNNVIKAADIIHDQKGLNIGARKITISTVGMVKKIRQYTKEKHPYNIAFSLNATNDFERSKLMPINKKYNLKSCLDALKDYSDKLKRPAMIEYVLISGVNDTYEDAIRLAKIIKSLDCKLNVIPYNPIKGESFKRPTEYEINNFINNIRSKSTIITVRWSQGKDVNAACGQLYTTNEKK